MSKDLISKINEASINIHKGSTNSDSGCYIVTSNEFSDIIRGFFPKKTKRIIKIENIFGI